MFSYLSFCRRGRLESAHNCPASFQSSCSASIPSRYKSQAGDCGTLKNFNNSAREEGGKFRWSLQPSLQNELTCGRNSIIEMNPVNAHLCIQLKSIFFNILFIGIVQYKYKLEFFCPQMIKLCYRPQFI